MDYYRKTVNKVVNDVKLKTQIGALTLKLSENNKKIDDLIGVDENIIKDLSTNLGKINNNSSTISTNFKQIIKNTGDISSNLKQISTNTSSISSNSGQINDNSSSISSNLGKINDNSSDISSNLNQINSNTKSILTNLEKIDNFTQYILESGKDFEEKYTIEKQIFRFNRDKHFYTMFEKEIEYNFTKNSLLFVKNNMYYKYDNLSNDYHRLQHEYNIYDGDNLIHKYLFNKDTYYDESPILHTNEDFCICFKKNYNKIKINLQLHRHNRHGVGNINLEIDDDDNENYINIDYVDRNNEQVDTNTRDISSNLIKINSNEDDILTNLNEINYLKNNKSYLKNVYNILFYTNNEQISFKDEIFYEKIFDINASKNDFIEMSFKIELEYRNINDRNYVKNIYEIFDENDNSLYIKTISNDEYPYFSNKVTIDEDIFINFTKNIKKMKFVIRFQKLSASRVIYLYYMKNPNYRFILKHYSS